MTISPHHQHLVRLEELEQIEAKAIFHGRIASLGNMKGGTNRTRILPPDLDTTTVISPERPVARQEIGSKQKFSGLADRSGVRNHGCDRKRREPPSGLGPSRRGPFGRQS